MYECKACGGDTKVVDSREDNGRTRRTRVCTECKHRFSTIEINGSDLYENEVVDRYEKKESFIRSKKYQVTAIKSKCFEMIFDLEKILEGE